MTVASVQPRVAGFVSNRAFVSKTIQELVLRACHGLFGLARVHLFFDLPHLRPKRLTHVFRHDGGDFSLDSIRIDWTT